MSFTKPSEKWPRTSLSYSEGPLHIPSPCKTEDNNTRPRTPEFPPFNLVSGWSHLVRCCYLLGVCACPNFSRETETERNLSFFLSLFLPSFFFLHFCLSKWSLSWGTSSQGYGGWEDPRSAICKLETQTSWWSNSVGVWRPEIQGSWGYKSQSGDLRWWVGMSEL